jgi:hypothetical protein
MPKYPEEGQIIASFWFAKNKKVVLKLFRGCIYIDVRKYYKGKRPTKAGITMNEHEWGKFCTLISKIGKALTGACKLKEDNDPPAEIFMKENEEHDDLDADDLEDDVDDDVFEDDIYTTSTSAKKRRLDEDE